MAIAFTPTIGDVTLENMRVTIGGTAMGMTLGGVTISFTGKKTVARADQYGDSIIKSWNGGIGIRAKFGLLETTYANMAKVLREATLRSSGGTAVGIGGLFAGSKISTTDGVALLFHPLAIDDGTLTRDINIWRAVPDVPEPFKYGPDQVNAFMVEYEGELDLSKTAGKMLADFGLAAAT
ncbi:MAG TPA: hypothetical protein VEA38_09750 [Terriglobales bacterium]|nr:hypothetical protein [Terriglobales bacterium]